MAREMNSKIPITIGITGHRDIKPEYASEVRALLKQELEKLLERYPNSSFVMLNSLASGADLLAADIAKEFNITVKAVLPFKKDEYIKDFEGGDKTKFEEAFSYAEDIKVVGALKEADDDKKNEDIFGRKTSDKELLIADRDACYREAGLYVAKNSHVLIALWDGKEGKDDGCGTADIVKHVIDNESEYAIIHILTPRNDMTDVPYVKYIEHEENVLKDILEKTDKFNKENVESEIYDAADSLSIKYQKKYKRSLVSLALIGVGMVLAFLIYDELDFRICLIIWGVLLIMGALIFRVGNRHEFHRKYIEYRMFAECLRVQKVLDKARINVNAASFYTWTHSDETFWIRKAISALGVSKNETSVDAENIVSEQSYDKAWIEEQLSYHESASILTKKKDKSNAIFGLVLKILTIASFIVSLVLEYFFGNVMQNIYLGIYLRTYFLVLIGTLSALTLLLSLYYGKLNLNRKYEDHINMAKLYKRALKLFERGGVTDEVILEIAREEIIENGNWYSYTKEDTLDINI